MKKRNFTFLLPLFLFCGALALSAACKKNEALIDYTPVQPPNTDSMPASTTGKYLALGDSYTIGTSVTEQERYPVQSAALLKGEKINVAAVDIIATNGWTTADLINGINNSKLTNSYDAVTLLIGVNNQYQGRSLEEYKQQFTTLLERAIVFAKSKPAHVTVLSIPDYSVTPFAKGRNTAQIASEIDAFNNAAKIIATGYHVQFLDVTEDSRKAANDPSLVASDGLHFSGKEYAVWSAKLSPLLRPAFQ